MKEPPRQHDLALLWPPFAEKVRQLLAAMQGAGYDPVPFETRRSAARQDWLYGIGRTHDLGRKPVTWTRQSRHLAGKAADIISHSRGWDWPEFYDELRVQATALGLRVLSVERCHVQSK